jgi:heme/copper-type cytochrome/quinol oxidase subunit 1
MNKKENEKHAFLKENGKFDWKKIIIRTFFMLIFIFLIFILYDKIFRTNVTANTLATELYNDLGYHGVALFVYLCDTFIVPLTPDVMFPLVSAD